MQAILERFDYSDQGTFGWIKTDGLILFTGECPWRDNRPNVSCVLPGFYMASFTHSPRFGRMLYLLGRVLGRSGIRIHPANFCGDKSKGYRSQLNGCIALGERLGWLGGQKAVLLSQPAVRRFEAAMGRLPFQLEIR